MMALTVAQRIAALYDLSVPDWPGEIDFYREVAAEARTRGGVLEVACGTGRVSLRLAQDGFAVTGLDISAEMLEVARQKSLGMANVQWVAGDMRSFDLGATYGLIIIPGHAFHNLVAAEDQATCLACVREHLDPGGRLVMHLDHQDPGWLGDLTRDQGGVFEPAGEVRDPVTGRPVRISRAWWYEPATQTASMHTVWEELDPGGAVVDRWERGPVPLHCVFRFEMEHLLARAGFEVEAVYGDFFRGALADGSPEMIWEARKPAAGRSACAPTADFRSFGKLRKSTG